MKHNEIKEGVSEGFEVSENLKQPSSEYLRLLDLAEKARSLLVRRGANGDEALGEVLQSIPQIVVVGPQSAGKSSVLSRLSGISFPTNSERCTRVATVLKLRKKESEMVKVRLVGKVKDEEIDEEFRGDDTEENIKEAQKMAVSKACVGNGFVDSLEIEIDVNGPEKPNLTLVDLPGLIAEKPDSDDPATVERIVRKYATMDGSLILFIVPVSQDYDTVLGQRIVSEVIDKTTVILTKVDKFLKDEDEIESRLSKILKETNERPVIVQANADPETETNALKDFQDFFNKKTQLADDFDFGGCAEVSSIMETKMRKHLTDQMPKVRDLIGIQIEKKKREVEEMKPCEKYETLLIAKDVLEASFGDRMGKHLRSLGIGGWLDNFRADIRSTHVNVAKNPRLRLEEEIAESYNKCLIYDKYQKEKVISENTFVRMIGPHLVRNPEIGDLVYIEDDDDSDDNYELREGTILKIFENTCEVQHDGGNTKVNKNRIFSREEPSNSPEIVPYILNIVRDQPLRNILHADPQPVLEHFAEKWSKMYEEVLRKASDELHCDAVEIVKKSFECCEKMPDGAAIVIQNVQKLLLEHLNSIREKAEQCVDRLVGYSKPPLVFTTNDHYYTSIYKNLVAESSEDRPTDSDSAMLLHLKWRAYRKVQVKVITEVASKDLIGLYTNDFQKVANEAFKTFLSPRNVEFVPEESKSQKRKRLKVQNELDELNKLLKMFNSDYSR